MTEEILEELKKRNQEIINSVIEKSKKVCPGSIALIGIGGSFCSGDIYEKSDLDLCIVINDDRGWNVGSCFILGDVAHDIYCTPWNELEKMAEYNNPYITKLLHLDIVYCPEESDRQHYMELRKKVMETLNTPLMEEDLHKIEEHYHNLLQEYANVMLSEDAKECKYASTGVLYNTEFIIYMVNKSYIHRGVKRIPEEIASLPMLPEHFLEFYHSLIKSNTLTEVKDSATRLVQCIKRFFEELKQRIQKKQPLTTDALRGSYEEIYSNWRNKMIAASKNQDAYLSLMSAASCQLVYDDMYSEYEMERMELMKQFDISNLETSKDSFIQMMENYRKYYEKIGLPVKHFNTIEEFKKDYLEEE